MIKIIKEKYNEFHVEIIKDTSQFKEFSLDFKADVYDIHNKTMIIGGKKEYDKEELLELFATIYKQLLKKKIIKASIDVNEFKKEDMIQVVMGLELANYNHKKTNPEIEIGLMYNEDIEIGEYICLAKNINIAKHLSNSPANQITPKAIIEFAKDMTKDFNVEVEVISDQDVKARGMMGLYSVGMGSVNRPELLILRYLPNKDEKTIQGLVGKGVTFDTGGYNLKPSNAIIGMQGDMGGAASVLAVFKTAIEQKVNKNIIAFIPLCENRISSDSLLPSDIITMYDGTTVEIGNTDAEGRLILGDAIAYAIKDEKVTSVLDMATLTGAAVGAFGNTITPTLTSSDAMMKKLEQASEITGEKFIRLPYYKEHQKMIESHVADLKNVGGPRCGVITAGLFLKHFAKDVDWMHLDIAGTHWNDSVMYDYHQKGATCGAVATVYFMVK